MMGPIEEEAFPSHSSAAIHPSASAVCPSVARGRSRVRFSFHQHCILRCMLPQEPQGQQDNLRCLYGAGEAKWVEKAVFSKSAQNNCARTIVASAVAHPCATSATAP